MVYVIVSLVSILIGGLTGFIIRMIIGKVDLNSAENKAKIILRESELEAESKKKELLLESKNSMIQEIVLSEKLESEELSYKNMNVE